MEVSPGYIGWQTCVVPPRKDNCPITESTVTREKPRTK